MLHWKLKKKGKWAHTQWLRNRESVSLGEGYRDQTLLFCRGDLGEEDFRQRFQKLVHTEAVLNKLSTHLMFFFGGVWLIKNLLDLVLFNLTPIFSCNMSILPQIDFFKITTREDWIGLGITQKWSQGDVCRGACSSYHMPSKNFSWSKFMTFDEEQIRNLKFR